VTLTGPQSFPLVQTAYLKIKIAVV